VPQCCQGSRPLDCGQPARPPPCYSLCLSSLWFSCIRLLGFVTITLSLFLALLYLSFLFCLSSKSRNVTFLRREEEEWRDKKTWELSLRLQSPNKGFRDCQNCLRCDNARTKNIKMSLISYTVTGKYDVTQLEEITKLEEFPSTWITFKSNRLCGNKKSYIFYDR
jgi:hypothetical protein